MKFILDTFDRMTNVPTIGVKSNKASTLHRSMYGFVPHYTQLANPTSDSDFKQKVIPPYPLVLAPGLTTIASKADKYPVLMLANEHNALGNVIYSTDLWEFFSDDSSETSIGIPNGTPTSNVGIDAVILNGTILTSHPVNTRLYHGAINSTPSWTASTGDALATTTRVLRLFQDKCLVTNASSGAFTRNDEVKIVASDFSISDGIILGDTFHVQDIAIHQDRYALLFAEKTTGPRLSSFTTAFLWDVVPGDEYDQKMYLRGRYVSSIVKDDIVHVFTQDGPTVHCHAFTGSGFQRVSSLKNTTLSEPTNIPKNRISIEGDFFVLLATSSGNTSTSQPLYWNPYTGESFFLLNAVSSLPYKGLLISQDPSTAQTKRYFSYQNSSSVGFLWSLTLESTTKTDQGAKYYSNLIPAPLVEGVHDGMQMGRMQINHIEIEYNTEPPSSSDSIALTLTTKDAYEDEDYDTQTATVKNTTTNSTNATVDGTRAIIHLGANATEFEIDLAVTVSSTSWPLIIRRIIVDFDPIALQS